MVVILRRQRHAAFRGEKQQNVPGLPRPRSFVHCAKAALQTFVRASKRARDDTIAHAELPERTSFPASKICARVATVCGQGQRMSARAVRAK
jgi:hypothetical protein